MHAQSTPVLVSGIRHWHASVLDDGKSRFLQGGRAQMRTIPRRAPAKATAPFLLAAALVVSAGAIDAREIPGSELVTIRPADWETFDEFGHSISAHRKTLVVGAPGDDSDAGSVYVFVRQSPTEWVQQAKLVATDGAFGDRFGDSVSVSFDTI